MTVLFARRNTLETAAKIDANGKGSTDFHVSVLILTAQRVPTCCSVWAQLSSHGTEMGSAILHVSRASVRVVGVGNPRRKGPQSKQNATLLKNKTLGVLTAQTPPLGPTWDQVETFASERTQEVCHNLHHLQQAPPLQSGFLKKCSA